MLDGCTDTLDPIEVPALQAGCRMTVVIPARNEQAEITSSLEALARQFDTAEFDVIVLVNNSTDATASRARDVARRHRQPRIYVAETSFAANVAHVGTARKLLMDFAAARFMAAGNARGIIATTDADTIVDHDWVATTLTEMMTVDAVAGFVTIKSADQRAMPEPVRALYARQIALWKSCTLLESLIDPCPEDPQPRHGAFVAASFAVTATMYRQAGGLPSIPCLEDREFFHALRRVDARIRHSLAVRASTSGRQRGQIDGGFSTFVRQLHDRGRSRISLLVSDPREIEEELIARSALRRIWQDRATPADLAIACDAYTMQPAFCRAYLDRSVPFGTLYERLAPLKVQRPDRKVPIEEALTMLAAAIASRAGAAPANAN